MMRQLVCATFLTMESEEGSDKAKQFAAPTGHSLP